MPTSDAATIAAVVLAAGSSTRMGQNKLVLELGAESLIRRAVRAAIDASLDPVYVVLGHEAARVQAELDGLRFVPIWNPRHAEGVATSLKAGVTAAASAQALVVILADMPFVTSSMIGAVAGRYRASRARLVVSRYGNVDAPPICYDRLLFGELLSEPGERCAKRVVRRHIDEAAVLPWPEEALRDIDVAADYDLARSEIAGS